jgi:hypothetical protein
MTTVYLIVGGYAAFCIAAVGWFAWWCSKPTVTSNTGNECLTMGINSARLLFGTEMRGDDLMIKQRDTLVSEHVAEQVREIRQSLGWTMGMLSVYLHDHRCTWHPDGYEMSQSVIFTLEHGVVPQHGYGRRVRSVSVDDLVVLAEVLHVKPEELLP